MKKHRGGSQAPSLSVMAKLTENKGVFLAHTLTVMGRLQRALKECRLETIITALIRSPYEFNSGEIYLDNPTNIACRIITAQPEEPPNEKPLGALEQQVLLNKHTDHS